MTDYDRGYKKGVFDKQKGDKPSHRLDRSEEYRRGYQSGYASGVEGTNKTFSFF